MIEAEGRHFGNPELTAGEQSAMPGNHVEISIDQDRHIETEGFNAIGDLPDLLLVVNPWVGRVGCQLFEGSINDFERLGSPGSWLSDVISRFHRRGSHSDE